MRRLGKKRLSVPLLLPLTMRSRFQVASTWLTARNNFNVCPKFFRGCIAVTNSPKAAVRIFAHFLGVAMLAQTHIFFMLSNVRFGPVLVPRFPRFHFFLVWIVNSA
jgi:hypothetical protein